MHCEQARQLFDAYLDGELSPSLATELGTHRVHCADCRQALALLEVSGHILRCDRDTVTPSPDFTNRLLACVDSAPVWRRKVLNAIYIGGPLAAAAVIALAFVGVFDGKRPSQVAGVKEVAKAPMIQPASISPSPTNPGPSADPAEPTLGDFIDRTQTNMKDKGDSVQRVLDVTVLQMLDVLESAKDRSKANDGKDDALPLNPSATSPPPNRQDDSAEEVSDETEDAPQDDDASETDTTPPEN